MDSNQIIARIDDWEGRLKALYALIDEWFLDLPTPDSVKQLLPGTVLQLDEELMREFDVPPRMLPTRPVIYGKNRISFLPSALWIIGGNGRVNVTTNTQRFILVDRGGKNNQPSDWQVVTSRSRHEQRPFDQQVFNNLVLHQAIEAA